MDKFIEEFYYTTLIRSHQAEQNRAETNGSADVKRGISGEPLSGKNKKKFLVFVNA